MSLPSSWWGTRSCWRQGLLLGRGSDHDISLTETDQAQLATFQAAGKTLMVVAVEGSAVGTIAVADRLRPGSRQAVTDLQALGIQVALLTGNNQRTAEVAITRVSAEVLPADKARYVKRLQNERLFSAMVGDGVNDAPALAQADLGYTPREIATRTALLAAALFKEASNWQ